MPNALHVANYFLDKVDRNAGESITSLKLYKLVYYAQAWSLVFNESALFDGEIQAWKHGPVPVDLFPRFTGFGKEPIPSSGFASDTFFCSSEIQVLESVWKMYGSLSAKQLRDLSHAEHPWLNARGELDDKKSSKELILVEEMREYYSNFINNSEGSISISEEALNPRKQVYVSLFLTNGEQVKVPLSELEEYIFNNMDSLQEACD